MVETQKLLNEYSLTNWSENTAHAIYKHLELPNWAPWLAANPDTIAGRSNVFPEGQLLIVDCERRSCSKFIDK